MQDDQIKAYFGFEENDLIANRNGELSEKQRRRIKEADRFAERFIQILVVLFLAGGPPLGDQDMNHMSSDLSIPCSSGR